VSLLALRGDAERESGMLLRLGWTLASGLLKPRLTMLEDVRVPLRVWPNDLDVNRHMNNSRYLLAMDLGRWDYGLRSGVLQPAFRRRWFPVAGSVTLGFRRPLDPFQRFELVTRLVAWDAKWLWFEQRFEVDGRVHAVGRVKALFRGPRGNVPTADLLEAIGRPELRSPPLPEPIRLWREAEQAERSAGA
jgi:acyl-CoA thioesterase FadM